MANTKRISREFKIDRSQHCCMYIDTWKIKMMHFSNVQCNVQKLLGYDRCDFRPKKFRYIARRRNLAEFVSASHRHTSLFRTRLSGARAARGPVPKQVSRLFLLFSLVFFFFAVLRSRERVRKAFHEVGKDRRTLSQ